MNKKLLGIALGSALLFGISACSPPDDDEESESSEAELTSETTESTNELGRDGVEESEVEPDGRDEKP